MGKNFEIHAKKFFLTYPQCNLEPKRALELLQGIAETREFNILFYAIAQERHEDGNFHLHCFLELDEQIKVNNCRYFDIAGFHGKYEGARKPSKVVKYCTKDGNYIANFHVDAFLNTSLKRKAIAKLIMEGTRLDQIVAQNNQDLLFGYKRLKHDILEYRNDCYVPDIREVKCKWFYGATRLGKSWQAIKELKDAGAVDLQGIYFKNSNNKYWENYRGQLYVLIDELPLMKDNSWLMNYMKKWTDKIPCELDVKNTSCFLRATHIYVTSQHSIEDMFAGQPEEDINALKERFKNNIVHVTVKLY